eukprot:679301-Pleurochrysis_carterae.AAC.3
MRADRSPPKPVAAGPSDEFSNFGDFETTPAPPATAAQPSEEDFMSAFGGFKSPPSAPPAVGARDSAGVDSSRGGSCPSGERPASSPPSHGVGSPRGAAPKASDSDLVAEWLARLPDFSYMLSATLSMPEPAR